MRFDPEKHHRRSIRLKGYDYSQPGAYFVTICTQNRICLFGDVEDKEMVMNDAGKMVQNVWNEIPERFKNITLDECIVMPNHLHGIIVIHRRGESCIRPITNTDESRGDHEDRPCGTLPGTLGRVIQAFTSITTHGYILGVKQHDWWRFDPKLWQRNYYDHIIRNEKDLNRIREYIRSNPANWVTYLENPKITDK